MAEKNRSKLLLAFASLLFLVVLPGISWYYLSLGRDWRREVVAELSKNGNIPPIIKTDARGLDYNFAEKSVCVIYSTTDSILTANDANVLDVYARLFSQFQAKENFKLVVIHPSGHPISAELRRANSAQHPNWVEIPDTNTAWVNAMHNGLDSFNIKLPNAKPLSLKGALAVTDIDGLIRRYYDISDRSQQRRLVEHIAILLPN